MKYYVLKAGKYYVSAIKELGFDIKTSIELSEFFTDAQIFKSIEELKKINQNAEFDLDDMGLNLYEIAPYEFYTDWKKLKGDEENDKN